MPVTFRSVGSYPPPPFTAAGATTYAVPYPSGVALGDQLLLAVADAGPNSYTTPSGWAIVKNNASIQAFMSAYVLSKTALSADVTASAASGTLSVTHGGSPPAIGQMVRYSGVSGIRSSVLTISTTSGTTSPAAGTLSPVAAANDLVVRFYFSSPASTHGAFTISSPGGSWVTRNTIISAIAANANVGVVTADQPGTPNNQTVTSSTTNCWGVVDVALIATPAPPVIISQAVMRAATR